VAVPAVDGILLDGGRVYAVQVDLNQIAQIDLSPDLSSGTVTAVISSPDFEAPTTAALLPLMGNTIPVFRLPLQPSRS
jgi:hypothetical protein